MGNLGTWPCVALLAMVQLHAILKSHNRTIRFKCGLQYRTTFFTELTNIRLPMQICSWKMPEDNAVHLCS